MGFSVMLWGAEKLVPAEYITGAPGADLAFFQGGGGGFDPTTMRSIFFCYFEPP